MIDFEPLPLEGALLLRHRTVADDRGQFVRLYCKQELRAQGLVDSFPQQNFSSCVTAGVLRGMHYQVPPAGEAKLVHCVRGAVFDVMVDMRADSPTFLKWYGCRLEGSNATSLYIPAYFAHGYQALEPDSAVVYHVSTPYSPENERQVRFDDPRIGIEWPIARPILSEKDQSTPLLAASFTGVTP